MDEVKTISDALERLNWAGDNIRNISFRMWRFHYVPDYKEKDKGEIRSLNEGIERINEIGMELQDLAKKMKEIRGSK